MSVKWGSTVKRRRSDKVRVRGMGEEVRDEEVSEGVKNGLPVLE